MNEKKRRFLQITILCIAVAFIGIGIIRKEYLEVLGKAVKICLECIGIG